MERGLGVLKFWSIDILGLAMLMCYYTAVQSKIWYISYARDSWERRNKT